MIESRIFPASVVSVTSTRTGGVSAGPYASLNTAFHVEDEPSCVRKNREILFGMADLPLERAVFLNQTHSTNICVADASYAGRGVHDMLSAVDDCDAVITDAPMLPIVIQTADCLPLVLFAPDRNVIAAIHCGWKGSADGIVRKTVERMRREKNVDVKRLLAFASACIGGESYEVGAEVAGRFQAVAKKGTTFYLDLRRQAALDLASCGVDPANIELSQDDTFTDRERFFSYRRDGVTGRMATVSMLRG